MTIATTVKGRTTSALSAAIITAFLLAAGTAAAAPAPPVPLVGPGTTAQSVFAKAGPHPVATPVQTNPCQASIAGMVAHIVVHVFGNRDDLTCTQAFPYGLDSPIGVNTYYPADIASMTSVPLIVMMPGILADPGMYDRLARQWASNGFAVAIPHDFVNSLAYVPAFGLAVAVLADRDPMSPLHGKIDLSRTVFAGHSAGGQAALQAASLFPAAAPLIDPTFKVAGVLAIEPGPLALGPMLTVPTLFLTGYNDVVVPDFAWVRWWQYNLTSSSPAWIANARGMSHFSPVDSPDSFASDGTALAWLKYVAFQDPTAKSYFVGTGWLLRNDPTYYTVERNARADAVQ